MEIGTIDNNTAIDDNPWIQCGNSDALSMV